MEGTIQQSGTERIQSNQSRAVYYNLGILQADKSDKQTNTAGNTIFQGWRNAVKNRLTDLGQGQNNKDNTLYKYSSQCNLPGIPHLCHYCKGKKRIQPHARRQHKGIIGKKRHNQRTNAGTNGSSGKYRTCIHAGSPQNTRIYRQNVCHRHKSGNTGNDLCADTSTMLL